MLGCHVHAKNTLDFTYLGLAENTLGAEVYPLHLVDRITPVSEGGYRVTFNELDEDPSIASRSGSVIGREVVVAAGALGSTELLLRCRDVHRTLPRLSPALGSRFSGNGDFLLAGALDTKRIVDPGQGPSITARITHVSDEHRITVEDLGFPDPIFWFLEGSPPIPDM